MDVLFSLADGLEASGFGVWARESAVAYPAANLVHLLGLVMLLGGIGILDLRLIGAFRAIPLRALWSALTPIGVGGLILLVASGAVLFAADAGPLARSSTYQLKIALIVLALLNAAAYRLSWSRLVDDWDRRARRLPRALALSSLLMWLTVAALGRLIAYT